MNSKKMEHHDTNTFNIIIKIASIANQIHMDNINGNIANISFEEAYQRCYNLFISHKDTSLVILQYYLAHPAYSDPNAQECIKDIFLPTSKYADKQTDLEKEHMYYAKQIVDIITDLIMKNDRYIYNPDDFAVMYRIMYDFWLYDESNSREVSKNAYLAARAKATSDSTLNVINSVMMIIRRSQN